MVDNTLFEKTHAKITALYFVPCVVHSCNKLHATRESWIAYRGWLFVQQVARYEGIVNRAPRLNLSCIKMHATRESWITYRGWFIRATSCTLRGNPESRIGVELFVHQDARYEGIVNYASGLNHSHFISFDAWFGRVTSYTLRGVKDTRYGASCKTLPLRIKKARHFHVVLFC